MKYIASACEKKKVSGRNRGRGEEARQNIFGAIKGNSRDEIVVNLSGLKFRIKSLAQGAKKSRASNNMREGLRRRSTEGANTGICNAMGKYRTPVAQA